MAHVCDEMTDRQTNALIPLPLILSYQLLCESNLETSSGAGDTEGHGGSEPDKGGGEDGRCCTNLETSSGAGDTEGHGGSESDMWVVAFRQ